ncbi:DUF6176 family protein [Streptococcus acidominimus]|nr:DUF6176 family protein [Streptococcus acidominimus]
MNYTVELTRFKVKEGKSAVVDEWMDFPILYKGTSKNFLNFPKMR